MMGISIEKKESVCLSYEDISAVISDYLKEHYQIPPVSLTVSPNPYNHQFFVRTNEEGGTLLNLNDKLQDAITKRPGKVYQLNSEFVSFVLSSSFGFKIGTQAVLDAEGFVLFQAEESIREKEYLNAYEKHPENLEYLAGKALEAYLFPDIKGMELQKKEDFDVLYLKQWGTWFDLEFGFPCKELWDKNSSHYLLNTLVESYKTMKQTNPNVTVNDLDVDTLLNDLNPGYTLSIPGSRYQAAEFFVYALKQDPDKQFASYPHWSRAINPKTDMYEFPINREHLKSLYAYMLENLSSNEPTHLKAIKQLNPVLDNFLKNLNPEEKKYIFDDCIEQSWKVSQYLSAYEYNLKVEAIKGDICFYQDCSNPDLRYQKIKNLDVIPVFGGDEKLIEQDSNHDGFQIMYDVCGKNGYSVYEDGKFVHSRFWSHKEAEAFIQEYSRYPKQDLNYMIQNAKDRKTDAPRKTETERDILR